MKQVLLFLVVCLSCTSQCVDQAQFFRTKVIEDSFQSLVIKEMDTPDIRSCFFHCLQSPECRRVLHCRNTDSVTCRIYDEGENCLVEDGNDTNCKCFKKTYSCNETDCSCPKGFYGDRCQSVVKDCIEAKEKGVDTGRYKLVFIQPTSSIKPFEVQCRTGSARILSRLTRQGGAEVNFNRTFKEYEEGFGNRETEYWIGLKKIRAIIVEGYDRMKIGFYIGNYSSINKSYYKNVYIGNKTTGYVFSSSEYKKKDNYAADVLLGSLNASDQPFSTFDNDLTGYGCAAMFGGGWWFASDPNCSLANINGPWSALKYDTFDSDIIEIHIEILKP